jgi:3-oxoadipate enol-lactonase
MQQAHGGGAVPSHLVQGQGEPLLLIMGLGGTKEAWRLQTRAFKRHYQVITFDNRGMGWPPGEQGAFTVEVMAGDTIALLDHLGVASAHILGYSLGGLVAQEIAIRHPERVRKLILTSTVAPGAEMDPSLSSIPKALGLGTGDTPPDLEGVDLNTVLPLVMELSFNRWYYRIMIRFLARRLGMHMQVGLDGMAAQLVAAASANTLERLDSIQAPTLVLTGAGDRLVDPSASRVLASRIPHAKLVMVEGGSHAFAIEMRRRFNREVLNFLREG